MSGVLLETFLRGKPVIVVRGSSLADQVERHGGGVIVDDVEPETVIRAIDTIRMDYRKLAAEALAAGDKLRGFDTGANLARTIHRGLRAALSRDLAGEGLSQLRQLRGRPPIG